MKIRYETIYFMRFFLKLLIIKIFYSIIFLSFAVSEIITEIKISGNNRISNETILSFLNFDKGDDLQESDLNSILKNLYSSNFFENVSITLAEGTITIIVDEAPIIQSINLDGVKAKKFKEIILNNRILKPRTSFNDINLKNDIESIKTDLKAQGYYFAIVEAVVETLDDNLIDIFYKVNIGEKSKISKISFIGDKIYKNKKLKNIIISEEYKFWKFISGKKYLQEQLINLDTRLLKNFYLNNGFYNVKINSSFAKLIKDNEFELIFNIQSGEKIFFGDLSVILPADFDMNNYSQLNELFKELKNEPYSINSVDKILEEIDNITINDEFKTINANVEQVVENNKLNIKFIIEEADKYFVEKINIKGNNITKENVIRNQLEIDEGDPYSDILANKSENNIKSLNFFKSVKTNVTDGKDQSSKIIDIEIVEKATGEIQAGAGASTAGESFFFGVKENNYLGSGIALDTNATISTDTVKGSFSVTNPNYQNTDKSVFYTLNVIEIDKLKASGFKTNKNGFQLGTSFEYLDDLNLGLSTSTFLEKIETNSTASARQKKQAGNYFDTFVKLDFRYDKRNQKFKTSDGFFSNYNVNTPIISDTNTLTNTYNFKIFSELYEDNISSFSVLLKNATSMSNDDIKLTERLTVPSSNLRGFEVGKVGPKDGADFIGGNYITAINLQSTLPVIFKDAESLDAVIFFDAANVWGVDYDSSIDDSSKIRSSIGVGVDWLTVIGPLNFSLTEAITKHNNDVEETFRFNLGTTF